MVYFLEASSFKPGFDTICFIFTDPISSCWDRLPPGKKEEEEEEDEGRRKRKKMTGGGGGRR